MAEVPDQNSNPDAEPGATPEGDAPVPHSADAGAPDAMAEAALKAAQNAVSSLQGAVDGVAPTPSAPEPATQQFPLPSFGASPGAPVPKGIDLLADVNLHVKIELGRTRMLIEDVLKLGEGAVVELDKLAGDPVDVYVNDRHIAKGEVLVLNDNFCVRINEIVKTVGDADGVAKAS